MKTVGERYSYWMLKVAELEQKLKIAEAVMCEESKKRFAEELKYTEAAK